MYPDSLKNLIESFKYLPGIGEKTAERLAFAVLEFDDDQCELFSQSLLNVKSKIKKCSICNTLTENDVCFVCSNSLRDNDVLCVVDDTKSVFLFEKLGMFNGYYHVLDGNFYWIVSSWFGKNGFERERSFMIQILYFRNNNKILFFPRLL